MQRVKIKRRKTIHTTRLLQDRNTRKRREREIDKVSLLFQVNKNWREASARETEIDGHAQNIGERKEMHNTFDYYSFSPLS